jgi:hypothetical protein
MKLLIWTLTLIVIGLLACEKKPVGGISVYQLTAAPYTQPLWHPSGTLLGYNYRSDKHPDSTGYYLISVDGSSKTKLLDFRINTAQWSKDGQWLAYSYGDNLYKVPFNGVALQLSQTVLLTQSGRNFFPSWNDSGDSLVFDSNTDSPVGGYRTWKMAADGSGKTLLASGRMPLWVGNNIYFIGRDSAGIGIMNLQLGTSSTVKAVPQPSGSHDITTLRTYGAHLFYQLGGMGIYKAPLSGGSGAAVSLDQLDAIGFDVSTKGVLTYIWYNGKVNATEGAIWIKNVDGSGKRQLTFNNL